MLLVKLYILNNFYKMLDAKRIAELTKEIDEALKLVSFIPKRNIFPNPTFPIPISIANNINAIKPRKTR